MLEDRRRRIAWGVGALVGIVSIIIGYTTLLRVDAIADRRETARAVRPASDASAPPAVEASRSRRVASAPVARGPDEVDEAAFVFSIELAAQLSMAPGRLGVPESAVAGPAEARAGSRLAGRLRRTVLRDEPGRRITALRFDGLAGSVRGEDVLHGTDDVALAALDGETVIVETDSAAGRRLLHLPAGLDPTGRWLASVLVAELDPLLAVGEPSWTRWELGLLGDARWRYSVRDEGTIARELVELGEWGGASRGAVALVARTGGRTIELDHAGRLVAIDGDERATLAESDGAIRVELALRTVLELVSTGAVAKLDAEALATLLAGREALDAGDPALANAHHESSVAGRERAEVAGRSLEELLGELEAIMAASPRGSAAAMEARHRLALLIRHDAGALARAEMLLAGGSAARARMLVTALGEAGSPEAQRLLGDLIGDPDRDESLRQDAILALVQTERPTASLAGSLAAVAAGAGGATSDRLSRSALVMLGGLASRTGDAAAREALEAIDGASSARLEGGDPAWEKAYLSALGNAAHPGVRDRVAPWLQSEDAELRRRAVRALRSVPSRDALIDLRQALLGDHDEAVRAQAFDAMLGRAESLAAETVAHALENDPSPRVRRHAVVQLGLRARRDEDARALLRRAATRDSSEEVRREARRALEGASS